MSEQQQHLTPEFLKELAAAQAEAEVARKTSTNPDFRSSYADLESVMGVFKVHYAKRGFAAIQTTEIEKTTETVSPDGEVIGGCAEVVLVTILTHPSGGYAMSRFPLRGAKTAQEWGSLLTYARRYSLAGIAGIVPGGADDDGNRATASAKTRQQQPRPSRSAPPHRNEPYVPF
jgi:hypothetical protein